MSDGDTALGLMKIPVGLFWAPLGGTKGQKGEEENRASWWDRGPPSVLNLENFPEVNFQLIPRSPELFFCLYKKNLTVI